MRRENGFTRSQEYNEICCGNNISDFHTQGPSSPFILLLLHCMEVLSELFIRLFLSLGVFLFCLVLLFHGIDLIRFAQMKTKIKNSKMENSEIRDHKCTIIEIIYRSEYALAHSSAIILVLSLRRIAGYF